MTKRIGFTIVHLVLMVAIVAAVAGPTVVGHQQSAMAQGQGLKWKLSKESGPAGKTITAFSQGSGWEEGSTVVVEGRVKGSKKTITLCETTVKDNGQWSCKIKIPKSADGKVSITLSGSQVISATTQVFNVTEEDKGGDKNGGGGNGKQDGNARNGDGETRLDDLLNDPEFRQRARCVNTGTGGVLSRPFVAALKTFAACVQPDPALEPTFDVVNCTITATGIPLAVTGLVVSAPAAGAAGAGGVIVGGVKLTALAKLGSAVAGVVLGGFEACDRALLRASPEDVRNFNPASADELGLAPSTPLQPNPDPIPGTPGGQVQEIREAVPTFGDVMNSMGSVPAAPTSSSVQEQHDEIRAGVCTNVPAGAGGCP